MNNVIDKQHLLFNENKRVAKLLEANAIDHFKVEGSFQHIVGMAVHIFNVPMAFVNFVDERSVHIKASIGVDGINEIKRKSDLCLLAVLRDEVTVFENTRKEPSLSTHPMVHGGLNLQFYAAAPIKAPDGKVIGVVAVSDIKPRSFSKDDEKMLTGLAAIVMEEDGKDN